MTQKEFDNLKVGDIVINNYTLYKVTNINNTRYYGSDKLCYINPIKGNTNDWDVFNMYTRHIFDLPTDLDKIKYL